MTDATAQQQSRLPVDASPPPERLSPSMLLAAAAIVLLLHLAFFTAFAPLAPDQSDGERNGRSALFMPLPDPGFQKMADIYDPIAFLHPPAEVGFSFFRSNRDDFALDGLSTPVPVPRMFADAGQLPPLEFSPVVRPLQADVAETDAFPEMGPAPAAVTCPYCVADSRPEVQFPAVALDTQAERILRRSPPDRPSVFEIRSAAAGLLLSADGPAQAGPFAEVVLTESCGSAELDLAARAWLDTLVNSQGVPDSLRHGDRCRVVWSVKVIGKEPSAR